MFYEIWKKMWGKKKKSRKHPKRKRKKTGRKEKTAKKHLEQRGVKGRNQKERREEKNFRDIWEGQRKRRKMEIKACKGKEKWFWCLKPGN